MFDAVAIGVCCLNDWRPARPIHKGGAALVRPSMDGFGKCSNTKHQAIGSSIKLWNYKDILDSVRLSLLYKATPSHKNDFYFLRNDNVIKKYGNPTKRAQKKSKPRDNCLRNFRKQGNCDHHMMLKSWYPPDNNSFALFVQY